MTLKEKLQNGDAVYGTWVRIPSTIMVEVLGSTGFDFLHLDLEHSSIDLQTLDHMVLAGYKQQIPLAVRTATQNAADLYRFMDLGVKAFILPRMESAEQLRKLISGTHYFPNGDRGLGGPVRANDWGTISLAEHMEQAQKETLIIAQIESQAGLDNMDEILDVKGLDILYIGPFDLSQALGLPGEVEHPKVQNTIHEMIGKIRSKGLAVGLHVSNQEQAQYWREHGVQYFTVGMDVSLLRNGAISLIDSLKSPPSE